MGVTPVTLQVPEHSASGRGHKKREKPQTRSKTAPKYSLDFKLGVVVQSSVVILRCLKEDPECTVNDGQV